MSSDSRLLGPDFQFSVFWWLRHRRIPHPLRAYTVEILAPRMKGCCSRADHTQDALVVRLEWMGAGGRLRGMGFFIQITDVVTMFYEPLSCLIQEKDETVLGVATDATLGNTSF